jgi:dolichyl-phosphate-mannose--protein O-mannosyl transferase
MKIILSNLIFTVLVSIFAYVCMSDAAKNATWVTHVNLVGAALGFVVAFQGVMQSKKYVGLLGLTQLSFWPIYGFFPGLMPPPSPVLQVLLTTVITLYLGASLVFFSLAFYDFKFKSNNSNGSTTN